MQKLKRKRWLRIGEAGEGFVLTLPNLHGWFHVFSCIHDSHVFMEFLECTVIPCLLFSHAVSSVWNRVHLANSWASLVAQTVKNPPAMRETWVWSLGWEAPWRREQLPTPVFWPGELHGLCSPWGREESDTTERRSLSLFWLILTITGAVTCRKAYLILQHWVT